MQDFYRSDTDNNKGQSNAFEVDLFWQNFIVSGFGKSCYRKHSQIILKLLKYILLRDKAADIQFWTGNLKLNQRFMCIA